MGSQSDATFYLPLHPGGWVMVISYALYVTTTIVNTLSSSLIWQNCKRVCLARIGHISQERKNLKSGIDYLWLYSNLIHYYLSTVLWGSKYMFLFNYLISKKMYMIINYLESISTSSLLELKYNWIE